MGYVHTQIYDTQAATPPALREAEEKEQEEEKKKEAPARKHSDNGLYNTYTRL